MAEFFQAHFQQSLQPREKLSVKAKVLKSMSQSKVVETDLSKKYWHLLLAQILSSGFSKGPAKKALGQSHGLLGHQSCPRSESESFACGVGGASAKSFSWVTANRRRAEEHPETQADLAGRF
jgi:hypothetical protein